MQVDNPSNKILILGRSGYGKTTYLIRYIQNAEYDHVFIFDHKLEFQQRLGIVSHNTIDECAQALSKGEKNISYHYREEFPGDPDSAFRFYCEWTYEMARVIQGKTLLAIDEVNRFTGTGDMVWEFGQAIEDGRLNGLDFAGTSHAANQIHNRLRLQLSEIIAFRSKDKRPLDFLQENGFPIEEVKALPKGAFILMNCDNDTFVRGKLFSCARGQKEVEPDEPQEIQEKQNALPSSPTDRLPDGIESDSEQHV